MSEATQALAVALCDLLAQVDALRHTAPGGRCPDPVRLRYIEALARRLQASPPAVQRVLQMKLAAALKAMGAGAEALDPVVRPEPAEAPITPSLTEPVEGLTQPPIPRKLRARPKTHAGVVSPAAPLTLLGQLNQHIDTATGRRDKEVPSGAKAVALQDLKSAVRFRETWARISAETEVDKAANRAPENAGPLNAHNLVLRTLALMRELSPDYLRRFMGHTESMLWLDHAYGQLKQPTGKARAGKSGKPKA